MHAWGACDPSSILGSPTMWELLFSQGFDKVMSFATVLPIASFSFLGSIVEEILSPIPSLLVALAIGVASVAQGKGLFLVIVYCFLEALGKTFGSFFFYYFADKAEALATGRFGRILGLSHQEIEKVGQDLEKKSFDDWALIVSRIIPAFPSLPVTLLCGLIKYDLKKYFSYSLVGFWLRSLVIVLPIYYGVLKAGALLNYLLYFENYGLFAVAIILMALVIYLIKKNRRT